MSTTRAPLPGAAAEVLTSDDDESPTSADWPKDFGSVALHAFIDADFTRPAGHRSIFQIHFYFTPYRNFAFIMIIFLATSTDESSPGRAGFRAPRQNARRQRLVISIRRGLSRQPLPPALDICLLRDARASRYDFDFSSLRLKELHLCLLRYARMVLRAEAALISRWRFHHASEFLSFGLPA